MGAERRRGRPVRPSPVFHSPRRRMRTEVRQPYMLHHCMLNIFVGNQLAERQGFLFRKSSITLVGSDPQFGDFCIRGEPLLHDLTGADSDFMALKEQMPTDGMNYVL